MVQKKRYFVRFGWTLPESWPDGVVVLAVDPPYEWQRLAEAGADPQLAEDARGSDH
jgi:hypothetical protein